MLKNVKRKLWGTAGLMLSILAVTSGCQSPARPSMYRSHIDECARAVQSGDLQQAQMYVTKAKLEAVGYDQDRQVESMEKLISGANAMMDGEVELAKSEWSQISDPELNREVRIRAEEIMDIEVPLIPVRKEN